MGGDGGSIPGRQDLVKTKKKKEQASREDENAAKWKHCALSQVLLRKPIVACELGRFVFHLIWYEHLLCFYSKQE